MTDLATPNLPSRNFSQTEGFYGQLGFVPSYRDEAWLILERGELKLEFFHHPELDPFSSWFSCCLRLDDLDAFCGICRLTGVCEAESGQPRFQPPQKQAWGGWMGALIDPDGTLLRLIQNVRH